MQRLTLLAVLVGLTCLFLLTIVPGCSTAPRTVGGRYDLERDAARTLSIAKRNDSSLSKFLTDARGYAVFPTVGKGAIGVGGAYGRGVLYEGGKIVGYCDLTQGTIGLQLGGQAYSQIIAFETQDAVDIFKSGNFAFSAQATAVALRSGAGANAKYADGVAVFTMDEAGLMFEAALGGQKFSYEPK
ncbi:MAG: lipid-binding SYLF domain-containing protein [Phycisphaeraceae bacterium]|nr:lipid-binding SYLF domain-containing protein [Phycisphaeraceae bacterium]MCW5762363.1 lipid-binding SYLF domain-containing protein [Phycisphaeraceae bacterium]